jgi:hypothetical protein
MEGFRTAFRQPEIALAEVVWRWAFGSAAAFLLLFSFFEYLDTLPVTFGDVLFLRSKQPFLVSQAIAHMLSGSAQRFVMTMLIVLAALALFWIAAASAGRTATARRLMDHFELGMIGSELGTVRPKRGVASLIGLSFLRVALTLATLIGLLAASILAGFVSSDSDPRPGLTFLIFVALAILVVVLWLAVNWFLSLAPLFVLSEGRDTFGSISAAVDFCRTRASAVVWSSTVFGVIHFLAFVLATSAAFVPLMLIGTVPRAVVFLGVFVVTLAYFAVVDFLYVGRLASYVAILARPKVELAAAAIEPQVTPGSNQLSPRGIPPATSAVDQDEPILSDLSLQSAPGSPSEDDILSDIPRLGSPPKSPTES